MTDLPYYNIKETEKGTTVPHAPSTPANLCMPSPCASLGLDLCIKIRSVMVMFTVNIHICVPLFPPHPISSIFQDVLQIYDH